jgi:hypothetical protein
VYRLLPGNGGYPGNVNHYIVLDGLLGEDFLYNDSAFGERGGRGLLISAAQLETAWVTADIAQHATAFGLGDERAGLLDPEGPRLAGGAGSEDLRASGGSAQWSRNATRMRAASDVVGGFDSTWPGAGGPAADSADTARHSLPSEDQLRALLREPPLIGGPFVSSLGATVSARASTESPADDVNGEILAASALDTAAAVDPRVMMLGVVASLAFLLLTQLVQTRFARLRRAPDSPPTRE